MNFDMILITLTKGQTGTRPFGPPSGSGRGSKTPTANHRRPLPFWTGCCGSSLRGVEWCEATNVEKQMGFECVLCLIGWGRRAERKVVQDSGLCVPPICVRTLMGREGFSQFLWRPLGEQVCRLRDILGLFWDSLEPTWGL